MKNFKKLKIWEKGMELVALTYRLAGQMPNEERFELRSQVTRAVVSIPSNIVEGSAKRSKKEYVKYLEIALGSAYELETQVLIIDNLNYGEAELRKSILKEIDEEQKMIQSFINSVESQ